MNASRTRLSLLAAIALVVASCGDDDEAQPTVTEAPATTASPVPATAAASQTTEPSAEPTRSAPPTTRPATVVTVATLPPAVDTTTGDCPTMTSSETVNDGFPMQMSSLVGADIRTGAHPCFERVVLELGGEGELPGFRVGYEDDPIKLSPSDQTVDVDGDATLVLRVAVWMTTMEGDGYQGPSEIAPANVEHIVELRLIENFEGMSAWAIGLDDRRPFTVTTLDGPPRFVIDVATN